MASICRLLEGLPLGIELAASWVWAYPCEEILRRLEADPDFLTASAPDMPARHRSLRRVFEYSWDLLTPQEQRAFRALAVFEGSFSLEAASVVASAPPPEVMPLADKSLLRRTGPHRRSPHAAGPLDALHLRRCRPPGTGGADGRGQPALRPHHYP